MFMFRFFLFLSVTMLAAPALAERAPADPWRRVTTHHDPGMARRHGHHHPAWWTSGLSFSLTRPTPLILGPPPRTPQISLPFEAPTRFRYYCPEPRGYFPAVTLCRGPWLETGGPLSFQE